MLKTYGTLPYSLATILKAFNTIEIRRKWDKAFSTIDVLDKREEDDKSIEVLYLYMKMPFIMSDGFNKRNFGITMEEKRRLLCFI